MSSEEPDKQEVRQRRLAYLQQEPAEGSEGMSPTPAHTCTTGQTTPSAPTLCSDSLSTSMATTSASSILTPTPTNVEVPAALDTAPAHSAQSVTYNLNIFGGEELLKLIPQLAAGLRIPSGSAMPTILPSKPSNGHMSESIILILNLELLGAWEEMRRGSNLQSKKVVKSNMKEGREDYDPMEGSSRKHSQIDDGFVLVSDSSYHSSPKLPMNFQLAPKCAQKYGTPPSSLKKRPRRIVLSGSDSSRVSDADKRDMMQQMARFFRKKKSKAKDTSRTTIQSDSSFSDSPVPTKVHKSQVTYSSSGPPARQSQPAASPRAADNDPNRGLCLICLFNTPDSIIKCRHVFCWECLVRLKAAKKPCPKCTYRFMTWDKIFQ